MCSTESVCDVRLACVAAWVILCSPKRFMRWRSWSERRAEIEDLMLNPATFDSRIPDYVAIGVLVILAVWAVADWIPRDKL
jgi:hypothetical protein